MSVAVEGKAQELNTKKVANTTNNNSEFSNSITKGSAGPAALAQSLMYEIMALYAEITELDQKQGQNMVKTQAKEAIAGANATKDAGDALFTSMVTSAVIGIGGSLLSLGATMGAQRFGTMAEGKTMMNDAKMENTNLNAVAKDTSTINANGGANPINNHADELLNGNFKNVTLDANGKVTGNTEDAIALIKSDPVKAQKLQDQIGTSRDRISKDSNSGANKRVEASQLANIYSQTATGVTGGASKIAEGYGQKAKAEHDAVAAVARAVEQMAGSESNSFTKAADEAFQKQNQVTQTIEKLQNTNSVQG